MTFTTDQLLDLAPIIGGQRADSFRFDLLDSARNVIGELPVSDDAAPKVRNDTTRSTIRTCSGVEISRSTLADIDVRRDRVRPMMLLQNEDVKPLGVFMFGEDPRQQFSWGVRWTPELFDETYLVDQSLRQSIGIPPGGSVLGLFVTILNEIGLPDVDLSGVPDQPSTTVLNYAAGSSGSLALRALAPLLGCYPPFLDNAGTYRLKLAVPPNAPPDHVYGPGTRVLSGLTTITSSAYRAPNRWIVTSDNSEGSLVGIYDLPDDAPNSYAKTGRIVTNSQSMQGLPTQDIANTAAYVAAVTDRNNYTKGVFSSTADPRHDTFELVELNGTKWAEAAWEIDCSAGGAMTHDLVGFFA